MNANFSGTTVNLINRKQIFVAHNLLFIKFTFHMANFKEMFFFLF